MKLKSKPGQSLIEVLTALAVVLLVLVALIRATTISMRSGGVSKAQALATSYAQEAIEWIRAERDKDWDKVSDKPNADGSTRTYCLISLAWQSGDCGVDDYLEADPRFKREADLTKIDKDIDGDGDIDLTEIQIEVRVVWQEAGGEHQSQLTTYLSNWR